MGIPFLKTLGTAIYDAVGLEPDPAAFQTLDTPLARETCRRLAADAPRLKLPNVPGRDPALARLLDALSPGDQYRALLNVYFDKEADTWHLEGSMREEEDMDKRLRMHPNRLLGHTLRRIAQTLFAPETYVAFELFLSAPRRPHWRVFKRRTFRVYVLYRYLIAEETEAASIAKRLDITPEAYKTLVALRDEYLELAQAYRQHAADIARYDSDTDTYRQSGRQGAAPRLKDYLTTGI